jgi:hypothetical protein
VIIVASDSFFFPEMLCGMVACSQPSEVQGSDSSIFTEVGLALQFLAARRLNHLRVGMLEDGWRVVFSVGSIRQPMTMCLEPPALCAPLCSVPRILIFPRFQLVRFFH